MMKKLVKPEIIDSENIDRLIALSECPAMQNCGTNGCPTMQNCNECQCQLKGWWFDDDKDEILF